MAESAITPDDIRRATWRMQTHLNMGRQGHDYSYQCVEIPELALTKASRKGKLVEQRMHVGAAVIPYPPLEHALDEAARLINRARRDAQDEKEWNAAAPTPTGAEPSAHRGGSDQ